MKKKRESAYVSTNVPSLRPLYRISHGIAMPKIEEKIRHTTGGDSSQNFPAWSLKKEKKNNKYLGGWGVEIQMFFWASHLIEGMGALV